MIKIIECPHCNGGIIIESINCGIFRHGVFKNNGQQINPHADEQTCEYYIKHNLIWGCGNPFKIINEKVVKCGFNE